MAKPINVLNNPEGIGSVPEEQLLVQKPPHKLSNNEFGEDYYLKNPTNFAKRPSGAPQFSGLDEFGETTQKILEKNKIPKNGEVILRGKYPENKVYFPTYDINNITVNPDININFILKINSYVKSGQGVGTRYKLFTSSKIYEYLVDAYNRNIPYPALAKLVDIVEIDTKVLVEMVKKQKNDEDALDVVINNNLGVVFNKDRGDYQIDYDILLKYIDWVVTKPGVNYDERLLSVVDISDVELVQDLEADTDDDDTTNNNNSGNNNQGGGNNTSSQTTPIGGLSDCQIVTDNLQPGSEGGPPQEKITATCNGINYTWNGTRWFPQNNNEGNTEPNQSGGGGNTGSSGGGTGGGGGTGMPPAIAQ